VSARGHGQIRRSQAITTWGPGSLIDLPRDSAIVGGLEGWPPPQHLEEVVDHRLAAKVATLTGLPNPKLYAPPPDATSPSEPIRGINVWRFPLWAVVREKLGKDPDDRRRRLVPRKELDESKGLFEGLHVIPTRFVQACTRGHIDDLDWRKFVHAVEDGDQAGPACTKRLWLKEEGTGGDLADLTVQCDCGKSRPLYEAAEIEEKPLGICRGGRPWIGGWAREDCNLPARLLIRTAANAYFPQVLSALSLPVHESDLQQAVKENWAVLQAVQNAATLDTFRQIPAIKTALEGFVDAEVLEAIEAFRMGADDDRPVKQVELEALLAQPAGFDDDVPVDPDFHARRLPESQWRHGKVSKGVKSVVQLHRMREVLALVGFTRFEGLTPDIDGDFDPDDATSGRVRRAPLAESSSWFPAIENRGEGLFLQLGPESIDGWLARPGVTQRVDQLAAGHAQWAADRQSSRPFPGGPYVLLHTLAHLLMQSLAMRCGYPATSIRERIYVDAPARRYGLLLYTASPDAEGTLGGLVQQARHIEEHLLSAFRGGALCSNDPVCAQHSPIDTMENRPLHGAACHGCSLVAETSCEMRNDLLDRALVTPTVAVADAAFFT
jgi:hypothetical protein